MILKPFDIEGCNRPTAGCGLSTDRYQHVDCDGDGILDHVCTTSLHNGRWFVLSSEGCPNSWGNHLRPISKCPTAFGKYASSFSKEHTES